MTSTSIHRLLDEAFAGATPSPAVQDLKEELRANLVARAEELQAGGLGADAAARRAFDELGDVRALIADAADDPTPAWDRERVRVSPGFVIRATLVPIAAAAALLLGILAACGVIGGGIPLGAALIAVVAVLMGLLVADSLVQHTRAHYPMPAARASGYGIGVALVIAAAGGFALCWTGGPLWAWLVAAGILLLAGVGMLAGLGATQTNRAKPWVREYSAQWMREFGQEHGKPWEQPVGDRFSRDPNAAARFGIYTMIIWILASVAGVIIGFNIGWWWSSLAWVAGFITMMLLLTRMLFIPPKDGER